MSVIKIIEVIASSEKGWEEATRNGVKEASKSIKNIKSVYVKEQTAVVVGENVTEFRVDLKISFEVQ